MTTTPPRRWTRGRIVLAVLAAGMATAVTAQAWSNTWWTAAAERTLRSDASLQKKQRALEWMAGRPPGVELPTTAVSEALTAFMAAKTPAGANDTEGGEFEYVLWSIMVLKRYGSAKADRDALQLVSGYTPTDRIISGWKVLRAEATVALFEVMRRELEQLQRPLGR